MERNDIMKEHAIIYFNFEVYDCLRQVFRVDFLRITLLFCRLPFKRKLQLVILLRKLKCLEGDELKANSIQKLENVQIFLIVCE